MNIFALINASIFGIAGLGMIICNIPKLRKYQVKNIFGIQHPVGITFVGTYFFLFYVMYLTKWQLSDNPSVIWSF